MARKAELVKGDDYGAVITAWTPLETTLVGQHPRLHLNAAKVEQLRHHYEMGMAPWASKFARFKQLADACVRHRVAIAHEELTGDVRGLGEVLGTLSLAWVLTREPAYLEAARSQLRAMTGYPASRWDAGLINGHWLYGHAIAYDWLFHDLDDETLAMVRDNLHAVLERSVDFLALHKGWMADAYACNHLPVHMAGVVAGAAAIYGEKPGVGPWLKFAIEKLNVMFTSLAGDGLSQESIGYGQYYAAFLLKASDIAAGNLGLDYVRGSAWLKNFPYSQIYLTLGSKSCSNGSIMGFGDGARNHWYGPSYLLRRIASAYRDGNAQAFADQCDRIGASTTSFLDVVWFDPTVAATPLNKLPLVRTFADKGVVAGRTSWEGDETVWAFKCGPHFGHHAIMRYAHDIGGGHMQADTGSLQITVRDERLLACDGYFRKQTAFNNTLLINGVGQLGEGAEWFEGLELRKTRRIPKILNSQAQDEAHLILADCSPAYPRAANLQRFQRTLMHQRPGLWLVIDETLADPGTLFEALFHSDYAIAAVEGSGGTAWVAQGPTAALRMTALPLSATSVVSSRVMMQKSLGVGGHGPKDRAVLVVSAKQNANDEVRWVTVMQAYNLRDKPPEVPAIKSKIAGELMNAVVTIGPLEISLAAEVNEEAEKKG
jgi:hypothetical protein